MPDIKELHDVNNALKELDKLEYLFNVLVGSNGLREIYRLLRRYNTNNTANGILIHSTNVSDEIKKLRLVLEDARAIILQRIKYDEQANSR